jgi:membrane glycosyltransferase
MALFGLCMLVLYAPKLFGAAAFLRDRGSRGLRIATVFGLITELLLSALVAPIMMLVQTSSVLQILTGRDSGWKPQARDADRVPWPLLWRFHRRHMLVGAALAIGAGAISWRLLAWMSPALLGLVLAVPLSALMGNAWFGARLARLGLLLTPEERRPPAITEAADREAETLHARAQPPASLAGLLADPGALARHLAWLDAPTARPPGTPDPALANALLKLSDGLGLDRLDKGETFAVLGSPNVLAGLAPQRTARAHG